MANVEDRIVKISFDNSEFERKISATLTSLGKLNDALKFNNATQGFANISAAADKVTLSGMHTSIDGVSTKFLALATIAVTALSTITTKAIQTGEQIAKSLTLDPILDGFREYETNIGSIQTILANTASKGTTLDEVTAALDKLNQYSDQTIYNFGEMARNIGTFTAAGVDLQTSVDSIKGIANIAAMSGSSSAQAATAMYQLSQAIASGTVKLMDWNSVVNAGMGGEAFQNALFETGKTLGTLQNIPMGQTFQEWKDAGNSFRDSLQDGWITADVLTTTLSAFTGDMTEEMLLAKGFSEEQALNIMKTADIAKRAATEVKTFSQLVQTVQEAVGTGWADSFRIVIGNFTEAKELWTNVNNSIGEFVSKNADARNEILQGWKDMGGRTLLIESLATAFRNLGLILQPIKDAFKDIFPPVTAQTLYDLTAAFSRFATALQPTQETVSKIRSVFDGLFSILAIGWEIIKEGTGFLLGLGRSLLSIFGPGVSGGLAKLGDGLKNLKETLVDDGGIAKFFDILTKGFQKPLEFVRGLKNTIVDFFSIFLGGSSEVVEGSIERIGDRFGGLGDIFKGVFDKIGDLWEPLKDVLNKVEEILGKVWDKLSTWFSDLAGKLGENLKNGDWDAVLDAVNTGLLGGIALLIANFLKKGFTINNNIDFGGGLLGRIRQTFMELTNTLKAMQVQIKAQALLKIASAIAVLTASVLVLSLIDSEALARALAAMAVGFGQLIGAFSLLTKMVSTPKQAAAFSVAAGGMILLGSALLVLSVAMKVLATMSWEETAKGLVSVIALLGALSLASIPLSKNAKGMITAGIGIMAMAGALLVLSVAMKIFATMSWEEMGKGLLGVAAGLGAMAIGLKAMPNGAAIALQGIGLIGVAAALMLLTASVATFGSMEWETIGKGMAGIGGGLGIIAGAMNLMPANMPLLAAGLVLVGFALIQIAGATKLFATMDWDEIARGLTAMAGALLILAGAMYLMGNNVAGGLALIVVSVGLGMLAAVMKQFSNMSWDEISHGLLMMAAALGAIALASLVLQPATMAILTLGAALIVLGLGFAAIGAGVFLIANGLEVLTRLSGKAVNNLVGVLKGIAKAIPDMAAALAEGLVQMVQVFLDAAPTFVAGISALIATILDALMQNAPKLFDLVSYMIGRVIEIIDEHGPRLIQVGIHLFMQLIKGIRDKIDAIVTVVADIIKNFLDAFTREIPSVAKSLADAIIQMFESAAYETGRVAGTLLFGVGKAFIQGLLDGIGSRDGDFMSTIAAIPGKVLEWIGDVVGTLFNKGRDLIQGLLNGIANIIGQVESFYRELPGNIINWVGDVLGTLLQKGRDLIQGLLNGAQEIFVNVVNWIAGIPGAIVDSIPNPLDILWDIGKKIMRGLANGLEDGIGLVKGVLSGVTSLIPKIKGPPKRDAVLLYDNGVLIMEGLRNGMEKTWEKETVPWLEKLDPGDHITFESFSIPPSVSERITKSIEKMTQDIQKLDDATPVLTPVIDMSEIDRGLAAFRKQIQATDDWSFSLSGGHARSIAVSPDVLKGVQDVAPVGTPSVITFTQTNNSPKELSTADIYRQTRNQISMAKEELKIR